MSKWDAQTFLILGKDRYGRPKILRSTSRTPALAAGEVAVKVVLSVDQAIFDTAIPVVKADIDASKVVAPPPTIAVINKAGIAMKKGS